MCVSVPSAGTWLSLLPGKTFRLSEPPSPNLLQGWGGHQSASVACPCIPGTDRGALPVYCTSILQQARVVATLLMMTLQ